jgi:hypothetical protein
VVSIGNEAAKLRLLSTVPEGVVAREVCVFLATFVVVYPGSIVD